jgi:hypothetical protein
LRPSRLLVIRCWLLDWSAVRTRPAPKRAGVNQTSVRGATAGSSGARTNQRVEVEGGLRQAILRWTAGRARLSRPLHPPRRNLERPAHRARPGGVTFKWKDYRIKGRDRLKTMTLDRLSGRNRRDRRCGSAIAPLGETTRRHRAGLVHGVGRGSLPGDARRFVSCRRNFCRRDRRRAPALAIARHSSAFLGHMAILAAVQ